MPRTASASVSRSPNGWPNCTAARCGWDRRPAAVRRPRSSCRVRRPADAGAVGGDDEPLAVALVAVRVTGHPVAGVPVQRPAGQGQLRATLRPGHLADQLPVDADHTEAVYRRYG